MFFSSAPMRAVMPSTAPLTAALSRLRASDTTASLCASTTALKPSFLSHAYQVTGVILAARQPSSMFLAASTRGIARRCLAVSFTDSKEFLPIERITAHPFLLRYLSAGCPFG